MNISTLKTTVGLVETSRNQTAAARTFAANPPGLAQAFSAAWLKSVAKHGLDPCTLPQAAAHEAGHIVVYAAVGVRVTECILRQRTVNSHKVWLGLTKTDGSEWADGIPDSDGLFELSVQPAETLARALLINLAGVAGEEIAGLYHPSSSMDERSMATQLAVELSARVGKPNDTGTVYRLFESATRCIYSTLRNHEPAMRVLRHKLVSQNRLLGRSIAGLIEAEGGVARIDSALAALGIAGAHLVQPASGDNK